MLSLPSQSYSHYLGLSDLLLTKTPAQNGFMYLICKRGLSGRLLLLFSFFAGPLQAEQRVTMRSDTVIITG
jgi:hypothetical protein